MSRDSELAWARPLVIAHRAAAPGTVENSRAGIRGAAAVGADLVELDIRRSLDGVPFLIHDPWLRRTTAGRGLVRLTPAALLRRLPLRGGGGETLPSLADALAVVPAGLEIGLHLKEEAALDGVLRLLRAHRLAGRAWLWLKQHASADRARRLAPEVRITLITPHAATPEERASSLAGAKAVGATAASLPWRRLSSELLAEAHAHDLLVFTRCPDDNPVTPATPADGFITSDPAAVRAALARG